MSDNVGTGKVLAAVGVAVAAAVTGVGLFLYLRQDDDDILFSQPARHSNQAHVTSFTLTDRLRVPRHAIAEVIGRGGVNVKRIQNETRTRIEFDLDKSGSGDKFAMISGSKESIAQARELIEEVISRSNVFTEEVNVPYHLIGNLIGRDGCVIRAMCDSSGARINVPRTQNQPISGFVPVAVKGTIEQVNEARRQINKIIVDGKRYADGDLHQDSAIVSSSIRPSQPIVGVNGTANGGPAKPLMHEEEDWTEKPDKEAKVPAELAVPAPDCAPTPHDSQSLVSS